MANVVYNGKKVTVTSGEFAFLFLSTIQSDTAFVNLPIAYLTPTAFFATPSGRGF